MAASLKSRLIFRGVLFMAIMAALLFVSAGTVDFWEGWVYLVVFSVPTVGGSAYFYCHDPKLIERRMQLEEKEGQQKAIMTMGKLLQVAAFTIPGLDHRYGWTSRTGFKLPVWLVVASDLVTLAGYLVTLWVMKANSFAASVVQVETGQKVVSTGPYRVVRHPMYAGAILMLVSTPLALGSLWALPVFLLNIPLIVWRLANEEKVLCAELPGYSEYRQQTRYRLVPGLW